MKNTSSQVETVHTPEGVEFHASARNEHGTGFDLVVSNPLCGMVDILLYQVVCHEVPQEPSASFCLPVAAAQGMIRVLMQGTEVAMHEARLKHYN